MRWMLVAALVAGLAGPALAQEDETPPAMPAMPDLESLKNLPAMPPPKLSAGQMNALKKGLDASPKTPGRAAMMGKLLKLAMAMKTGQKVDPAELAPLIAYLRESNAAKKGDPAFEGALQQLEAGMARIQGMNDNPDMDELKKEFEGY